MTMPPPPPSDPPPQPRRTLAGLMTPLCAIGNGLLQGNKPTLWGHAAISAVILTSAATLYGLSYFSIQRLARQWDVCPQTGTPISIAALKTAATAGATPLQADSGSHPRLVEFQQSPLPDMNRVFRSIDKLGETRAPDKASTPVSRDQIERLEMQLIQFQRAQQTACRIGVFFFAHRNATLTIATAAAIMALGSLALISKEGWEKTNNTIINISLTSGLILFTTITYSQLYGQGSNFESQKAKVILATNALNSVASAVANRADASIVKDNDGTGISRSRPINLTKGEDMAILINTLDRQLEVLVNLDFSGDASFAEQSAQRLGDLFKPSGGASEPDR